jgi:hypothetical protein
VGRGENLGLRTYIKVRNEQHKTLPEPFTPNDDVRANPALIRKFLDEYTRAGDLVFDPFAGFGTTLITAEEMGRRVCGIEYLPERCAYIRDRLSSPDAILLGDARQLASYNLPRIDFSMTPPPFMHREDPEDPFSAYQDIGRGYDAYLTDIREIYRQMRPMMTETATAVLEVWNLKRSDRITPLAWDVADVISQVLDFKGEVVVEWEPASAFGYDHIYCLIFSR